MRKKILILILFVVNFNLHSQITTTIFPDRNAFKELPMLNQVDIESIPLYEMPSFNLDSVIKEEAELDEKGVGRPFRFGYAFDVNYGIKDKRIICKDIDVKNVTVTNGKILELESIGGSVKINAGFTVESGAGFIIK